MIRFCYVFNDKNRAISLYEDAKNSSTRLRVAVYRQIMELFVGSLDRTGIKRICPPQRSATNNKVLTPATTKFVKSAHRFYNDALALQDPKLCLASLFRSLLQIYSETDDKEGMISILRDTSKLNPLLVRGMVNWSELQNKLVST